MDVIGMLNDVLHSAHHCNNFYFSFNLMTMFCEALQDFNEIQFRFRAGPQPGDISRKGAICCCT